MVLRRMERRERSGGGKSDRGQGRSGEQSLELRSIALSPRDHLRFALAVALCMAALAAFLAPRADHLAIRASARSIDDGADPTVRLSLENRRADPLLLLAGEAALASAATGLLWLLAEPPRVERRSIAGALGLFVSSLLLLHVLSPPVVASGERPDPGEGVTASIGVDTGPSGAFLVQRVSAFSIALCAALLALAGASLRLLRGPRAQREATT